MMNTKLLHEFYKITVKDPLFAAEGLDLDNAQLALEELTGITKKLQILDKTFAGQVSFFFHPLTDILHPLRFLRKFLESEKARRRFLGNPSFVNAKMLVKSYFVTTQALEKDLLLYRLACLKAQRKTLTQNPRASAYVFYCRKVTFKDFIDSINMMLLNAETLQREVEDRSKLLLSSMQEALWGGNDKNRKPLIPRELIIDPIPQIDKKGKPVDRNQEIISWIEHGRDFMYFLKKRYGDVSTEMIGPIFYKLSQFDSKPTVHQFFVSIAKDLSGLPRYFFPILADQFHFVELEKDKYKFYADIVSYEPLTRRKINYWYQPATSFYFTSDLTYYADLATIVDLKRRPFLNKSLLLSQKSSLLDLFLWNGYFHNLSYFQNIEARFKAGRKIKSWHYLLIGRSYPSLYYLPFNKSVYRLEKKPNFLGSASSHQLLYLTLKQLPTSLKKKDLQNIFEGGYIRAEDTDKALSDTKK